MKLQTLKMPFDLHVILQQEEALARFTVRAIADGFLDERGYFTAPDGYDPQSPPSAAELREELAAHVVE